MINVDCKEVEVMLVCRYCEACWHKLVSCALWRITCPTNHASHIAFVFTVSLVCHETNYINPWHRLELESNITMVKPLPNSHRPIDKICDRPFFKRSCRAWTIKIQTIKSNFVYRAGRNSGFKNDCLYVTREKETR